MTLDPAVSFLPQMRAVLLPQLAPGGMPLNLNRVLGLGAESLANKPVTVAVSGGDLSFQQEGLRYLPESFGEGLNAEACSLGC
jgi:hypothetical protein